MHKRLCLVSALAVGLSSLPAFAQAEPLRTIAVSAPAAAHASAFDGVVEAVRQTVVAAQVAGALVSLEAKVGDRVKAGQVLARIDARAALQTATAADAQVNAARAALEVATRDFDRQKQLFEQRFISQAALDRAESELKSTQAQVNAQMAQAGASRTQSGLFVVYAPYAGMVSDMPVALGDMALPGKPLYTLYDPQALRVTVSIPQSLVSQAIPAPGASNGAAAIRIELPAAGGTPRSFTPSRVQMLPTVDPATHTVQVRLDLSPEVPGLAPGMFARVWFTITGAAVAGARLYLPLASIVRRAEMVGVYVIDASGKPVLRQIRLGRTDGDRVEILSGVAANERVALDPQAAARVR